ncbi:MAG: translation elongation factor Ts [Chloroflexi bacterium]|nr:translation elongation factor Ts [Chloroflexota bacterium]
MGISVEQIKALRAATGAGILDCRKALEEAGGDFDKAVEILRKKGLAKAAKKAGREASEGVIETYVHGGGRIGVMLELNCETDFVARSEVFRNLAHELALQIAAMAPQYVRDEDIPQEVLDKEAEIARERAKGKPEHVVQRIVDGMLEKFKNEAVLMRQAYIRDDSKTIQDLINEHIASIGENIVVRRFVRWELGETAKAQGEAEG